MCLQARCNVQSFCLFSKAHARAPSGQSSQSLALVIASRVPYPLARSMNNSAHSLYLHFFSFIPLSPTRRLMLRAQNSKFAPPAQDRGKLSFLGDGPPGTGNGYYTEQALSVPCL